MIFYFLILIVTAVSWVAFGHTEKNDYGVAACLWLLLGVSATVGLIASTIYFGLKSSDAKKAAVDRDYYQECVYSLNDQMSFPTIDRILSNARSINERIETNKKNADNAFCGWFYNKAIGEIEPIDIPELRISTTIYMKEKEE